MGTIETAMDYLVVLFLFVLFFAILVVQSQAIIGGNTADWGKYPYVAKIEINQGLLSTGICTGCAVAEHTILTAAHCVVQTDPSKLTLTLGNGQSLTAEEIKIHPNYRDSEDTKNPSIDVALIRVKESIKDTMPLQFDPLSQTDVSETILAGFGQDERGRIGVFKTGRATLYDRGFIWTSRRFEGTSVCQEFEANRSIFESNTSACRRCNELPHCSCDANGRCMKDGSPNMAATIMFGDSGGAVFYMRSGVIHSVIGVNSATIDLKQVNKEIPFQEALFAKTTFNEDFLRSTLRQFEGGDVNAGIAEPINRELRPIPIYFGPSLVIGGFILLVAVNGYQTLRRGVSPVSTIEEDKAKLKQER